MKDKPTNMILKFYLDFDQKKWVQIESKKEYDNIKKVGGIISVEFIDSIDLEDENKLRQDL